MSKEYHTDDVVDNVWDGHNSLEVMGVWYFIYTSPSNRYSGDILWARLAHPTKPPCDLYDGPRLYMRMVTLRLGAVAYAKEILWGAYTNNAIATCLVRYLPINAIPPLLGHPTEEIRYEARRRIVEGPFTDVPPIDESIRVSMPDQFTKQTKGAVAIRPRPLLPSVHPDPSVPCPQRPLPQPT